ncbi:TPR repeat-containing thioredoxin TTL4-like [Aristolochia californica]|uniref:TPR repeat-containing thioredoxin TTL4-like n=1 Tax=Aristolochia californica TaxID=171875 RepID=UPI0035DEF365
MGFDINRNVVSSKVSLSGGRNLRSSNADSVCKDCEGNYSFCSRQKNASCETANATGTPCKSSVQVIRDERAPFISCKKSDETHNSWKLEYKRGGKSFVSLASLENIRMGRSSHFLNKNILPNTGTVTSCQKVEKSREKDNLISHSSPSNRSCSNSGSPNSVLWKQEENSKSMTLSKEAGCQGANVLSFGNIYRGTSKRKHACRENPVVTCTEDSQNCKEFRVQSNAQVLGLGGGNYGHGNVIKSSANADIWQSPKVSVKYKNVEELKSAGNEEYKRGNFLGAISLYDQAITLSPRNAPCHNNKAAALVGLGRYPEAVGKCLEAIQCDPFYSRAHYRLGCLYTRLGRVEDAKYHFLLCGQKPDSEPMDKLLDLESHLSNMRKARKIQDWQGVLIESNLAIHAGANASEQVLACKAEALLKLHKANEALEVLLVAARELGQTNSKRICMRDASLLVIQAQVYMYLGRFDDGVKAAEQAVNLDSGPESLMWLKKMWTLANARKTGNELYKAGKYIDACEAYGQGLESAPSNSVLLCNRAACRSKLGQWAEAVEDCTAALNNRPGYTKAHLRRAYSYARLKLWEESLADYKVLRQEIPGDLSIAHSLHQVESELKKIQQTGYKSHLGGHMTCVLSY